jgi:uncharacterized membrane-anchored protein YjiN (DUF445 family)
MKRAELRRMRLIATLLLVGMTVLFIATSATSLDWPWLGYLRAFAEAGMVGACADWFAVVALFRHPLGVPIPHTAVVPNNKERIGRALGRFITNNFLATKVASQRLAKIDMVFWAGRWIEDPQHARALAEWVVSSFAKAVEQAPRAELGEFVSKLARRGIEAVPAAPLSSKVLSVLWAEGKAQPLLDQALDYSEASLLRNKDFISRKVAEQSSRWVPKWVDSYIAGKVMTGLLTTMRELRAPEHPWRQHLGQMVDQLIVDLAHDRDLYTRGEELKADLLASPVFREQLDTLWDELDATLRSDFLTHAQTGIGLIVDALRGLGKWLEEDAGRRAKVNRQIRLVVLRVLLPRRVEIGSYISHVVETWDSATLVDRLELQVGKDLQYIRINGTLVGGLVGLLIFAVTKVFAAL